MFCYQLTSLSFIYNKVIFGITSLVNMDQVELVAEDEWAQILVVWNNTAFHHHSTTHPRMSLLFLPWYSPSPYPWKFFLAWRLIIWPVCLLAIWSGYYWMLWMLDAKILSQSNVQNWSGMPRDATHYVLLARWRKLVAEHRGADKLENYCYSIVSVVHQMQVHVFWICR